MNASDFKVEVANNYKLRRYEVLVRRGDMGNAFYITYDLFANDAEKTIHLLVNRTIMTIETFNKQEETDEISN